MSLYILINLGVIMLSSHHSFIAFVAFSLLVSRNHLRKTVRNK